MKGTSRSLRGDHCLLGCHQTTPVASQCQCSRIAAPRAICRRLTRHVKSCIGPSGLVSTLRWLQGWASLGLVKLFFDWDWRGRVVRAVTENEYTCDRGIASDTAIPYRETRPERSHARWLGLRECETHRVPAGATILDTKCCEWALYLRDAVSQIVPPLANVPYLLRRAKPAAVGLAGDFIGFQLPPTPLTGDMRLATRAVQDASRRKACSQRYQVRPVRIRTRSRQVSSVAFWAFDAMTKAKHDTTKGTLCVNGLISRLLHPTILYPSLR